MVLVVVVVRVGVGLQGVSDGYLNQFHPKILQLNKSDQGNGINIEIVAILFYLTFMERVSSVRSTVYMIRCEM